MRPLLRRCSVAKKDRDAVRQGMGDLLNPSSDLLSQVLEGDRRRTGRVHPATAPVAGPNELTRGALEKDSDAETPEDSTALDRTRQAGSDVVDTTRSIVGNTTDETVASVTDIAAGSDTDQSEMAGPESRLTATARTRGSQGTQSGVQTKPKEKGSGGDRKETQPPSPSAPTAQQAAWTPLEAALREMLGKPYTTEFEKGPFTVTSMKIHTEVSERLGWAASLTKRPKQDIVSEALRLYFERLLREG